jgi:cell division septal protein FtsQ
MARFRKPHRIKRKKSILSNRFFWLGILILAILGAIFYFLFFSEIFQVKQIIVTSEKEAIKEDLKLLIEKELEKRILFLKTKSIFLVNLNKIKKDILNHFPQIAEVEMGRGFPDAINVLVIERSGLAIWCQKENCFLLDNEGFIFREIPAWTDLPKIVDRQEKDFLNLGEKAIEKEILNKILEIESELTKNLKILIDEFSLISDERLNAETSEGWEIYFNLREDINWQLTKLSLVLEEEIPPENRGNLEYIDLRFGRVYYKYRE